MEKLQEVGYHDFAEVSKEQDRFMSHGEAVGIVSDKKKWEDAKKALQDLYNSRKNNVN